MKTSETKPVITVEIWSTWNQHQANAKNIDGTPNPQCELLEVDTGKGGGSIRWARYQIHKIGHYSSNGDWGFSVMQGNGTGWEWAQNIRNLCVNGKPVELPGKGQTIAEWGFYNFDGTLFEPKERIVKTNSYKPGTETGSLMNLIMSGSKDAVPTVGMGATILMWTDRIACTIVEVSQNGKRVGVREDIATRTDSNGMSDSQDYAYQSTEGPAQRYFTLRKNGAFVTEGDSMRGTRLAIGYRRHYHDFSF